MRKSEKTEKVILYIGVIIIAFMTLTRVFNSIIWCDEAYSIMLAKSSIGELLRLTAEDVHPPLHYVLLKIFCRLFGFNVINYHLVVVLPFLAMLLFAATIFYKRFGFQTTLTFIIFSSVLPCAFEATLLIRMYSLAMLFVTICFYAGYEILENKGKIYWILFTLCGIGAAYSHYFAFASVCFIYFFVFSVVIFRNRKDVWKCVTCALISIAAYLPWLLTFIKSVERVNEDYWIGTDDIPTIKECIEYFFGDGIIGMVIFTVWIISCIIILWTEVKSEKREQDNKEVMIVIAILTVVGMITFGTVYSYSIQPIFLIRYLYPLTGIVWLILGISLSKVNKSRILTGLAAIIILAAFLPNLIKSYNLDKTESIQTNETLQFLNNNMKDEDVLVSNLDQLTWRIFDYYLEGTKYYRLDELDWSSIKKSDKVFLYYSGEIDTELVDDLKKDNFQFVKEQPTYVGRYGVTLYVLEKQ